MVSHTNPIYTLFRDSAVGQAIYHLTGGKLLVPTVLRDDYIVPEKYLLSPTPVAGSVKEGESLSSEESASTAVTVGTAEKLAANNVVVDWDGEDDPENPYNWPTFKRAFIAVQIACLTFSSYMASAIFTPAEEEMMEFFGTTEVKLMLGLTLFVWGYGITPIFVSTMSESPSFGGRRWIFLISEFLFAIFQIPTALTNHLAPFAVLRFLAGLCAGPPLSNGPAAIGDVFTFPSSVYMIMAYSVGAVVGPFFGPLFGAALTNSGGWRWVFWFLLIQAGVVLAVLLLLFPETSTQALLMRKARHLRARTGNPNIIAPGEIKLKTLNMKQELKQILWYPIELCLKEPVLDLVNLHLTLIYTVIYLFFEGFPIVFVGIHHFPIVSLGATYVSLMIGIILAVSYYFVHLKYQLIDPILAGKPKTPEASFGYSSLLASICVPIGLFIFGWTATASVHWIAPLIGATVFVFGTFILFQSYFGYLANVYATRFASALSSNTVARSMVGGAFPLFGRVFFTHTGSAKFPVGWGSSILGFAGLAMIGLPIYFIFRGPQIRERARARWGEPDQH